MYVGYDSYNYSCLLPSLCEDAMRTVQMTLDDALIQEIDHVVKQLGTTRSALRETLSALR